jgi:hypothetical protein
MIKAIKKAITCSFDDLDSDGRAIRREYDFTMRLFMFLYEEFPDKIMNADNPFLGKDEKERQSDITIVNRHSENITHIIEVKLGRLSKSLKDAAKDYGVKLGTEKAARWIICFDNKGGSSEERESEAMTITKDNPQVVIVSAKYPERTTRVYKLGKTL